jgi:hypothetical protein
MGMPMAYPVPLTDEQHANKIRNLIRDLSAAVNAAQDTGLTIDLSLGSVGRPQWEGYMDAAKIVRKL